MNWWRRLRWKRSRAPTPAVSGPLESVLARLETRITDRKRAVPVLDAAARFRDSPALGREERFVPVYMLFEQYLSQVQRARVDRVRLRQEIRDDFPDVCAHPSIAVIFAPDHAQEVLLQRQFLEDVIAASFNMVGTAGSDFLTKSVRQIAALGDTSTALFHSRPGSPDRFVELEELSRSIYEFLAVNVGEGAATRIFEHAYAKTLGLYRGLERFAAVLRLLPEQLLDEEKLALLSRDQMESALLANVRELRGRNEDLAAINRELVLAQAELEDGREELEIRVRERTRELARAELRLRTLTESIPDAIVAVDKLGTVIAWNAGAERMFGYSAAEMYGQSLVKVMPERYHARHEAGMRRVAGGAPSKLAGHTVALHGLHRDGHEFPLDLSIGVWTLDGQNYFSGVMRDTTERATAERKQNELQDQLRQAQKMEAIGRMAGGVAHDFNNLLTIIKGYADLLRNDATKTGMYLAELKEIGMAAERAAGLTAQLLAISRTQPHNPLLLDFCAQIRELEPMLRRVIEEQIDLRIDLGAESCNVTMDSTQAMQVVLNLTLNAKDAMPQGGSLTIATDVVSLREEDLVRHVGKQPGAYVRLRVADTGSGIAPEAMNHLFEPFFTTKVMGKGTGLGLSVVYGIVEQAGGFIDVETSPDTGTEFSVFLPRSADPLETPAAEGPPGTDESGGELVLLIEDQTSLRALARRILVEDGYDVIAAAGGVEALRLIEERGCAPDLVVTDVVMPHTGGPQIVKELVQRWGSLKVVFVSGYSRDLLGGDFMARAHFLAKPFSPDDLAAKVREALDAGRVVRHSDFAG